MRQQRQLRQAAVADSQRFGLAMVLFPSNLEDLTVTIVNHLTARASARNRRSRSDRTRLMLEPLEERVVPAVLSTEHVDIRVTWDGQNMGIYLHDETNDVDYAPDQALLHCNTTAAVTRPDGSQWDFLGASAGDTVYVLPQDRSFDPPLLYLGTSGEDIDQGIFATYFESDSRIQQDGEYIRIDMVGATGPGNVSVFQTDQNGEPANVWMSTYAPPDEGNSVFIVSSGDQHNNIAFTQLGVYTVTLRASAYLGPGQTNQVMSDPVTFYFYVGDLGGPSPNPGGHGNPHGSSLAGPEQSGATPAAFLTTTVTPGQTLAVSSAALQSGATMPAPTTPAADLARFIATARPDQSLALQTTTPAAAAVDHVFQAVAHDSFAL
jgi:surface-anchored protein